MATRKPKIEPTLGGSTYVDPSAMEWRPSQFKGIQIKVLFEDQSKGEMTCLLKWEPGATLPMHKHPEIEQSYVLEGSFYDQEHVYGPGDFIVRAPGALHTAGSEEGAVVLLFYSQKPNGG